MDAPREVCIKRDAAMGTHAELLKRWNRYFDDELGYMERDEPEQFVDFVLDGTVPFEEQLIPEERG